MYLYYFHFKDYIVYENILFLGIEDAVALYKITLNSVIGIYIVGIAPPGRKQDYSPLLVDSFGIRYVVLKC